MAKTMTGVVASDSADKTISVIITTRKTHPLYKKQYRVTKKFLVHDENNSAHIGDSVEITPVRPISKRKHYDLLRVLETARLKHVEEPPTEVAKEPVNEKPLIINGSNNENNKTKVKNTKNNVANEALAKPRKSSPKDMK